MKTIMIVGAGKSQVPLIEAAKKEGYHTVVCDLNPDAPGAALADEYCRVSTKDRDGLYRAAQEKRIDGIVANSEYAMMDVAFISQELGLVGNPEEAIAVLSSKSKFRAFQKQIGLFAPRVMREELTYPVLIKPDMCSGTRGATVVNKVDDISKAVSKCRQFSRNDKAIIEEYVDVPTQDGIEGEIFIHNGEILWDGLFTAIRGSKAPMIPMTYVFPVQERAEKIDRLKESLKKAFRTAGVIHGEYNIEAFFVNDEPFIIEINPRQGGNDLPKYVQEHCGIDYYRLLVTTAVGDESYWNGLKCYERQNNKITHHMLYPMENGRFKSVRIAEEIKDYVSCTKINVTAGNEIKKADDGSASIGFVDLAFENTKKQTEISSRLEYLIRIEFDEDRTFISRACREI